jgi:hypothetical protein
MYLAVENVRLRSSKIDFQYWMELSPKQMTHLDSLAELLNLQGARSGPWYFDVASFWVVVPGIGMTDPFLASYIGHMVVAYCSEAFHFGMQYSLVVGELVSERTT